MGLASYEIVGGAGEWRVSHEGKAENVYQTKKSAFEAAVAAASTGQTGARGTGGLLFAFDEKLAAINTAGVLRRMRPDNESSYGTAASGGFLSRNTLILWMECGNEAATSHLLLGSPTV